MSKIDALEIWDEIQQWDLCESAVQFYGKNNLHKDGVLKKGAANFDHPVTNLPDEKPIYRAAYYAGQNGYMDMHIKQNKFAFERCLPLALLKDKNILFVDMGCGPMTSGLALAEKLSSCAADYKTRTTYFGIDISENMCDLARDINKKYEIFDHFQIINGDSLNANEINSDPQPDIAILCFSYVFASDTYQHNYSKSANKIESLANSWHKLLCQWKGCRETNIIYLNPDESYMHKNWGIFATTFRGHQSREWGCTPDQNHSENVEGVPRPHIKMIIGKRQG